MGTVSVTGGSMTPFFRMIGIKIFNILKKFYFFTGNFQYIEKSIEFRIFFQYTERI